ncbi:MAG: TrbI/VirB10 family protein [Candidatus Omnitrophica bacterium]|nr:TrbI/VirB10 family protein [Candidatus Omnitrophota bacterium]MCB9747933.1 TrbI/VirB10 family protein [Candidatus Omnitrophota bacterium]
MKIMDYLFKKDHSGQRRPSLLFIFLLIVMVFGSYFLSGEKKENQSNKIKSDPVIASKDVHSTSLIYKSKEKQEDLIKPLLFVNSNEKASMKERRTERKSDSRFAKSNKEVNAVIYDSTLKSRTQKREVKVPLGSMVQCVLIHNIITNNFSSPVILQVKEDFYFNGELLFPKDTRIFGEAKAGRERDRVLVAFRTILFKDGYEVNFNGRGLNRDGSGGFKAEIINEKTKKKILSQIMNFLGGTLLGFQEKSTNTVTGLDQLDVTTRNAILEGSAKTLTDEAKRMEAEINASKGYGVVAAGTYVILYIDSSFQLTRKTFR